MDTFSLKLYTCVHPVSFYDGQVDLAIPCMAACGASGLRQLIAFDAARLMEQRAVALPALGRRID